MLKTTLIWFSEICIIVSKIIFYGQNIFENVVVKNYLALEYILPDF